MFPVLILAKCLILKTYVYLKYICVCVYKYVCICIYIYIIYVSIVKKGI